MDESLRQKAGNVTLAVFDVDGVMTDGSIMFDDNGTEYKSFHAHDGLGLVMLQAAGVTVAIVSSRVSGVVSKRMSELGIKHVLQGVKDKKQALAGLLQELDTEPGLAAFVGDDLIDLPAMSLAGLAVAVANARPQVIARADWTTSAPGGQGGVREICEMLLDARGKLADAMQKYTGPSP